MALGVFPAVAVGNGGHPNNSTPPTKASKAKAKMAKASKANGKIKKKAKAKKRRIRAR